MGDPQRGAMRLAAETVPVIREAVLRADPAAESWLFGSRVDDAARGGDIDLLIVSDRISFSEELRIRAEILDRIGWQRLDLVVRRRDNLEEPFAVLARETGVRL